MGALSSPPGELKAPKSCPPVLLSAYHILLVSLHDLWGDATHPYF